MNKMKQLGKKLRSRCGESIAEVLIALLIAALGLTLLAAMITSASRMIRMSKQNMEAYTATQNALVSRPSASINDVITVDSGKKATVSTKLTEDYDTDAGISVKSYTISVTGKSVIAYAKGS